MNELLGFLTILLIVLLKFNKHLKNKDIHKPINNRFSDDIKMQNDDNPFTDPSFSHLTGNIYNHDD